jgi:hypothetical protein
MLQERELFTTTAVAGEKELMKLRRERETAGRFNAPSFTSTGSGFPS